MTLDPTFVYNASVLKVIDGDTVDLMVDCGFRIGVQIRTRLLGINAPELNTAEGKVARDFLRTLLPVGLPVTTKTYKDPGDKYGRWLALIQLHDGQDVCATMLSERHAVTASY